VLAADATADGSTAGGGATAGGSSGATAGDSGWRQRDSESERETVSGGAVTLLKRSLPSARDLALGKDFLKIKK
jgi:hypothetical protein